jgi:hypothetical protein
MVVGIMVHTACNSTLTLNVQYFKKSESYMNINPPNYPAHQIHDPNYQNH